ncbi:MAG: hypothetical protein ACXWLG_09500 [Myxococcaceae bacterium]
MRDALSTLLASDDFRVRAVTDAEPPVRPLGPFAVVDLARGTLPDTAGLRERSGYYALVEELLTLQDAQAVASPSPATLAASAAAGRPSESPSPAPATPTPEPGKRSRTGKPAPQGSSVAERIAPRRRAAQSAAEPRGRFTQVEAERSPLEALEGPAGRTTLETLLAQHGHRPALLRALAQGYSGRRGSDPSAAELDTLLTEHGLIAAVEDSERSLVLDALSEQRGALGRVAWALGLRGQELEGLISRLGLGTEVDRLRERFRREALNPASWTARLDLLGRRKYLEDLGIERDFDERLRADLLREIKAAGGGEAAHPGLARRLGAPPTLVGRALERLGLLPEASTSLP